MSARNFNGAAPDWTHRFTTQQHNRRIPMPILASPAQQYISGFQGGICRHYGKRKPAEFATNTWKVSRGQFQRNNSIKDQPRKLTYNQERQSQPPTHVQLKTKIVKLKTKSVAVQCLWEEGQEWPGMSYASTKDWSRQPQGLWDHPPHWALCTQEALLSSPGFKYITPTVCPESTRPVLPWKRPPPPRPEPSPQALENIQRLQEMNETLSSELKKMKEQFSAIQQAFEQKAQAPSQKTPDLLASASFENPSSPEPPTA